MGFFRRSRRQTSQRPRNVDSPQKRAVFSYYQNQESLPKNEVKRPRQPLQLSYIPSLLAALAIIASVLYSSSLSTQPKVIVVNEKDQAVKSLLRPAQTYEVALSESMRKSFFSYTKLTVNTDNLANKLKEQFPELSEVAITIPIISRRPVAYLQITKPEILLTSTNGSYVVDEKGRVIMEASKLAQPDQLSLLPVNDQTGVEGRVNEQVLPEHYVTYITTIATQTAAKGLTKPSFTLPALANELHARFEGVPYTVKFSLEGEARQQTGTFLALKQKLDTDNIHPLEYIDVRVDERAYYK